MAMDEAVDMDLSSAYSEFKSALDQIVCSVFQDSCDKYNLTMEKNILTRSIKSCIRCCDEHQIYSDIYFSVATKLQRCSDEIFDAFYTHDSTMVVGHHHQQQPPPPQQRHLGAVDTTNTDSSSSFMLARSCQLLVNVHKLMSCFGNALQELFEALQLLKSETSVVGLNESFQCKLLDTFKVVVVHVRAEEILESIKLARKTPFAVDPSVIYDLVFALHKMKPELHVTDIELFSCYIPNVKKPCSLDELNQEILATKQLHQQLQSCSNFQRNSSLKRKIDEQMDEDKQCSSSLLLSLLMNP